MGVSFLPTSMTNNYLEIKYFSLSMDLMLESSTLSIVHMYSVNRAYIYVCVYVHTQCHTKEYLYNLCVSG